MRVYFVYILKCSDDSYYIGRTHDIEKRLAEHRAGIGSEHTAKRLPIVCVFLQEFGCEKEAYALERQIKGWSRKKKEALIEGNWNEIIKLSNTKK